MDSNLLAVREGEMRMQATGTHYTQRALMKVWLGGRPAGDMPNLRELAAACSGEHLNPLAALTSSDVETEMADCPDCAVLRDYAEENASAT